MQSKYGTKIKTEHGCLILRTAIDDKGQAHQCCITATGKMAELPRPSMQLVMDSKAFNKSAYSELLINAIVSEML